jgi:hypothetical protein
MERSLQLFVSVAKGKALEVLALDHGGKKQPRLICPKFLILPHEDG